jgi:exopolysaccharide production protein ExoQ
MSGTLALLIFSVGVAGLFYLDRNKSVRTSKALWLPVIWLWIAGSRPVSLWLGMQDTSGGNIAATLEGSPVDAAIFEALIIAGVIVLCYRKNRATTLLKASGPILVYFFYCLLSTTWSPIHGPAFKRWIKAVGDLVMVLVLVTEVDPIASLRRLYSRVGFILLPFSIPLIRWTSLGVSYDENGPANTGVTTNKNALGLIVFLISLGALWNARALILDKKSPNRTRRLVAQCTLLLFGLLLFKMAHCATAIACFVLGAGLMLATGLSAIRKRPARVHALCMGIILAGGLTLLFGGESMVTGALGRRADLGRTDIWKASIAAADSPIFGTGFESFWNCNVKKVAVQLTNYWGPMVDNLVSAHNGYIQVYLDLGWVGVCLIAFILISGYRHAVACFRRDPQFGGLLLTYVATCAFYSITEVGFRILTPSWVFLLLAVVSAYGFSAGLIGGKKPRMATLGIPTTGGMSRTDQRIIEPYDESLIAGSGRSVLQPDTDVRLLR